MGNIKQSSLNNNQINDLYETICEYIEEYESPKIEDKEYKL